MPHLDHKPPQLATHTTTVDPKAYYFYLRQTGEVFENYESYLERLFLYKRRKWTCSITGKSGLTYEEALHSEKQASFKLKQEFDDIFLEPLCRLIHLSWLPLEQLSVAAYERFKNYYCIGETAHVDERAVKIINIKTSTGKPFKEKRAEEFLQLSVLNLVYEAKDLESNQVFHIKSCEMEKKRKPPVSKNILKLKIRETSCRDPQRNAILFVKPELVERFNLFRFDPTNTAALRNGDTKSIQYMALGTGSNGVTDELNTKTICNSLDDIIREQDDCLWPEPTYSSNISSKGYGDLIYIWKLAHVFGEQLGLAPFSLFDFENALCYHNRNALLDCLFQQLLIMALENHEDVPESSGSRLKSDAEKTNGWESVLVRVIRYELRNIQGAEDYLNSISEIIHVDKSYSEDTESLFDNIINQWLTDKGYRNMNASERLVLLRMLCDIALGAEPIRTLVDDEIEELADKRKRKRLEIIESRQNLENEIRETKRLLEELREKYGLEKDGQGAVNHFIEGNNHTEQTVEWKDGQKMDWSLPHHKSLSKRQKTLLEDKVRQEQNSERNEAKKQEKKLLDKVDMLEKKYRSYGENLGKQLSRSLHAQYLRHQPLGIDRSLRRYWLLEEEGLLLVEVPESRGRDSRWGYYSNLEQLSLLYEYLNERIRGESILKKNLDRYYSSIALAIKRKEALKEAVHQSKRLRSRQDEMENFLRYKKKPTVK
eukprot:jgi/Galph1/3441/GphlegSOOS_G2114.1